MRKKYIKKFLYCFLFFLVLSLFLNKNSLAYFDKLYQFNGIIMTVENVLNCNTKKIVLTVPKDSFWVISLLSSTHTNYVNYGSLVRISGIKLHQGDKFDYNLGTFGDRRSYPDYNGQRVMEVYNSYHMIYSEYFKKYFSRFENGNVPNWGQLYMYGFVVETKDNHTGIVCPTLSCPKNICN